MHSHVYKKIELTGTSPTGIEDAIHNALKKASESLRLMRWFEVTETRGSLEDGVVAYWQVTIKVGLQVED